MIGQHVHMCLRFMLHKARAGANFVSFRGFSVPVVPSEVAQFVTWAESGCGIVMRAGAIVK